ncbi:uncharacterized protein LOC131060350 [Cryptomeria japonica]|uniref:uncharacterized protein LOC131060350 n=1 Tax=Cryptomeria japonica TaxID=3369 RepID=UPI0027DAAC6E|nr:uncharacterized protein LOC131060350 [Cryptomeria japonica]
MAISCEKADANEVVPQFPKSDDWFTANYNLFRVMCIVPDKQDYSYVEKVQLPEDEILGLCNKLVPASATSYSGNPPRIRINFKEFDRLYLSAMGFYGDKKMMIEIFHKQCLVGDSVVSEMKLGQFMPGLYVIVPKEATGTLVAFYWHEGEHFKEASRKDVSCNFIRYLVELCDYIYVCVEGEYNFGALAIAAAKSPSKVKCTQKMEVKRVKSSENDMELLPGFNVRVAWRVKLEMALPLFCEGYHRCCLLTAENRAPRTEVMDVQASEFDHIYNGWLLESRVYYSKLSNEHFLNLLQCCYRGKYQKYLEWKDSFKPGAQLGIMADKVKELERCFLKILPEFCSHVLLFIRKEWSESKARDYMDRYDQLHGKFSMMLAGEDGRGDADRRVLMDGSDIRFICNGFEHRITIQILGKGKPTLSFITYEQELSVRCSSQCPCSRRIDGTTKFLPLNSSKNLLLSGDKVKLVKLGENKKNEMEGTVQLLNSSGSVLAMRSWVENMVPAELKNLERNIVFTTFLLSSDYPKALMFIEKHLEIDNLQTLPVEFKNRVNQFQHIDANPLTIDPQKLLSHKKITTVCDQVYKKQEHKFLESVKENLSSVLLSHQGAKDQEKKPFINLRDAKGMVTKYLGMEKDKEESEEREKQFKPAEDKYIQELKKNMPKNREGTLVTRYIEEVAVIKPQSKLKVKVSIVEDQKSTIVWKAQELIALKKDIDELNSNCEHPIVPTCGQSFELVAINREQERLVKVVALRSGVMIVFIENFNDHSLYLYHCSKIGSDINMNRPFKTFRRLFDLLAVDESSRYMALYEKVKCKIGIYKFNESFRKVDPTGVEVHLEKFTGSSIITWMHLIPGKMELLIIDNTNRVRLVEIHENPMVKPNNISLSWSHPISKACISPDGFFLIVFRQSEDDGTDKNLPNVGIQLEIFVLGDMMSHLKTIHLNANPKSNVCDLEQMGLKITNFGSQSHLVLYNYADSPYFLSSHVLKTVIAGEVSMLQKVQNKEKEVKETEIDGSCSYLGYIYHIFDKFGTTPALFPEDRKSIMFKVVLKSITDLCNGEACIKYLEALLKKLRKAKEKNFSNITIDFQADSLKKWTTEFDSLDSDATNDKINRKMGVWVRSLICLVPLQIARAENNGVVALKDGLQIPPSISIVDSVSLANSIRFGLYDAVLDSWKGKIKVISSMGKQSSGKSYLLNHLSGSLLDVSGGRCTDGVWITVTTTEESADAHAHGGDRCLYVLLDFEGLGSFERTEQEDMPLSVVNAAVSNLTIFNKKDFHLDKDTEIAFKRFQGGINLISPDEKLFKGLFYIAIKDVDRDDVEDLILEFSDKISQICRKSEENFITKMYGGKFEIAAMAPYNRSDYYGDSLSELAETVKETDSFYDNGSTFLRDLKLVISQIVAKDWTSIDSKRVGQIVDVIRRNLKVAINMGCLSFSNADDMQGLVNFDTQEEIPDEPVVVGDFSCNTRDQGLCLLPSHESSKASSIRDVLCQLRLELETVLPRKGNNGESWHSEFENFLRALGERRHDRVQHWVSSNTVEFCDHEEVKMLQLEASLGLGEVKQGLSICGGKCSVCFWRCVLEKGHDKFDSAHSCMGSHSCTENCTYCFRDGDDSSLCGDLAGHEGAHNCKEKNHTCGETCHLVEISSNYNKVCSLGPEHPGLHKCNSPQHVCKTACSLPSCNNPCAVPIEPNHKEHRCHENIARANAL